MSGVNYHGYTHRPAALGGTDPIRAFGNAVYEIKIYEDNNFVLPGDGAFYWPIPAELDDSEIISVEAGVSTVSSSGNIEIQLRHFDTNGTSDAGDVLSTKCIIEATEKNSKTAATQSVITGGTRVVAWGDWLRVDVDAAGTGAMGLTLMVTLTPSPLGSIAVTGAKGDPGGITDWKGAWNSGTTYTASQAVSSGGSTYVAITGSTAVEPGVTGGWQTYWQLLQTGHSVTTLAYVLNGNGYVLDTGIKGPGMPIYFACTIVEATLLSDWVGSVVVDIWKDTYGSYPPTNADSITASAPLTLSGANKTTDTTLTGWTKTISAGDVLRFNIDSCTGITALTIGLKVTRS